MKHIALLLILATTPLLAEETPSTGGSDAASRPAAVAVDPEQAVITRLRGAIAADQWQELNAGGNPFSALYLTSRDATVRGTVILLHDIAGNADENGVVGMLRRQLPEHGWHTLSLQLPLFIDGATDQRLSAMLDQAEARLGAALAWEPIAQQGVRVVIGHGLGAHIASRFVAGNPRRVDGLVVIAMGSPPAGFDTPNYLGEIEVPLLDLYGSRDRPDVLEAAAHRRPLLSRLARTGLADDNRWPPRRLPRTRQVEIHHADHDFSAMADQLHPWVANWLRRIAEND